MPRDDIWLVLVIIALIVIGVVVLISPGNHVTTGQVLQSPPAMSDSSAGSSTGESGKALPTQTPAKSAPSAPVQSSVVQ
jgi:hypothetical protein